MPFSPAFYRTRNLVAFSRGHACFIQSSLNIIISSKIPLANLRVSRNSYRLDRSVLTRWKDSLGVQGSYPRQLPSISLGQPSFSTLLFSFLSPSPLFDARFAFFLHFSFIRSFFPAPQAMTNPRAREARVENGNSPRGEFSLCCDRS